jgi:hypothetical protein
MEPHPIQTPFCEGIVWVVSRMRRSVVDPVEGTVTPSKTFVPGPPTPTLMFELQTATTCAFAMMLSLSLRDAVFRIHGFNEGPWRSSPDKLPKAHLSKSS